MINGVEEKTRERTRSNIKIIKGSLRIKKAPLTLINSTIKIVKKSSKIAASIGRIVIIWKYGIPIESIKAFLNLMEKNNESNNESGISVIINDEKDLVNQQINDLNLLFKINIRNKTVIRVGSAAIGLFQFIRKNFFEDNKRK